MLRVPETEMFPQMPRNQPVNDDIDDDDDDDTDPSLAMKNMRRRIKELEKSEKDLTDTKRELAMVKAGVNTDSKLGQMFAKHYEGDLSDIEAIKADATEMGLIKTETKTEAEATESTTKEGEIEVPAPDASATTDRRNLATGALPDDGKGVDVRADAMKAAETSIGKGSTFQSAAGGYINKLAQAAMSGDQSVLAR